MLRRAGRAGKTVDSSNVLVEVLPVVRAMAKEARMAEQHRQRKCCLAVVNVRSLA